MCEREREREREKVIYIYDGILYNTTYLCLLQRILIMYSVSTEYSGPGHSPRALYIVSIIKRA